MRLRAPPKRLVPFALSCIFMAYVVIRQLSCLPKTCSLLPSGEVGIRTPEPSLGPREDLQGELEWCRRMNALEDRVDGMLASGAVDRAEFDPAYEDYVEGLAAWRKAQRAHPDEGGPRQPRCRANHLGGGAHKAGLQLPEKYRKRSEHTTWGQYTGLMYNLADSLLDTEQCRDFHMMASWIWQWCSYGDWYLPDYDPDFGRLMPYIEDGKVRARRPTEPPRAWALTQGMACAINAHTRVRARTLTHT